MALDGGKFYRSLDGHIVRLAMAGARKIRPPAGGIPGPPAAQDLAYFYFFAEPVDLGAPDETLQQRPIWRATESVQADEPRADEHWIAQAEPDLLILTNRKALLAEILQKLAAGSKLRTALPGDLPEWTHVDSHSPFWGLRHYSTDSKPKRDEPGFEAAELPVPDGSATGVTVRFDSPQQKLEVQYLSAAQLSHYPTLGEQFEVDQPEAGVFRLQSDLQQRGQWPMDFAMAMLGFGVYR